MKWEAELATKDRSMPQVAPNFDLLWYQFHSAKIKMDLALEYITKACKAHHPSDTRIKGTFKKMAPYLREQGLDEYGKSWKAKIDAKCKEMFFTYYDIEGVDDGTEKVGGMSRSEHTKLQKYADGHETVDWEALLEEKNNVEPEEDDIDIDLDKVDININLEDL